MTQFLSDAEPDAQAIEDALIDFGFYHQLIDAERMYAEWVNHGNYGYAGGVLDQPEEYWRDMGTMRLLELYVKHVAPMPRLEQVSVFDQLRKTGRFGANWLTHGNN
jgi:hypothetical protein